jgi:hypothetical protein
MNYIIQMFHFNEIIISDPMIETLSGIDIGCIALTCKKNFINLKTNIGNIIYMYLKLYLGFIESNYKLLDNDEKVLDWITNLVKNKMDLFREYYATLYDDIKNILKEYSNQITRDIIILIEFSKRLYIYQNKKNDFEMIDGIFNGITGYDRINVLEIFHYRNFIDHITICFKLQDLSLREETKHFKYKRYVSLDFFKKILLEIGGTYIYDFCFAKNNNQLCSIIDNKLYLSINLSDVFRDRGIILKCIQYFHILLYIQLGNVSELLDMECNKTYIYEKIELYDTVVSCRYLHDKTNIYQNGRHFQSVVSQFFSKLKNPIVNKTYTWEIDLKRLEIVALHLKINDTIIKNHSFMINNTSKTLSFTLQHIYDSNDIYVVIEYEQLAYYENNYFVMRQLEFN